MQKLKIFLVFTGYQITWLACVFGEIKFSYSFIGLYVGIIFFFIYFYFSQNKKKFLKITFLIAVPGYFFDTFMVYFQIYEFNTSVKFGTLPLWMIALWLSFSTLFDEILYFFKKYRLFGIILSGMLGPLTYYLGEPIGVLNINNLNIFLISMIFFWIFLMVYYLNFVINIDKKLII
tara:strand:- start:1561 stop:2088 length:528 start_codon:yes stop_codon:yes gene_type:complete